MDHLSLFGKRAGAADAVEPLSRRQFLYGSMGLGSAVALGSLAGPAAASNDPKPRAKSVLAIWLTGGPPQMDTFDPKPLAPVAGRSPLQPILTQTPGVHFTEVLPRLAARSNRFAVVRSTVLSAFHSIDFLTGHIPSNRQPNIGSIIARHRKSAGLLPAFVMIRPSAARGAPQSAVHAGSVSGFLGPMYDPHTVFCSSDGSTDLAHLRLHSAMNPQQLDNRRSLRSALKMDRDENGSSGNVWNQQWEDAYRLLTDPRTKEVFDLRREPENARDAYGHTTFGQSLLLARRLIEAGVPYVWVQWSNEYITAEEGNLQGWDTHVSHYDSLTNWLAPVLDRSFSALLDDLAERGLLDSTLVMASGEMGRTPEISANGGRDHWATGSSLWAGAGVQGGKIVGATDNRGGQAISNPVTVLEMGTTIAELAGVNAEVRAEMRVLENGRVIHELF